MVLRPICAAWRLIRARYTGCFMEFNRIQNAIDLLGQAPPPPLPCDVAPPEPTRLSGQLEPKLGIAWGDFNQGTLSSPKAPLQPPTLLPKLPNMVQFQQSAAPARPRLQISEEMLRKLRPRVKTVATESRTPLDAPNLEQRIAEISLPAAQNGPARPKLELNAGAAPRLAQRTQSGEPEPAPA